MFGAEFPRRLLPIRILLVIIGDVESRWRYLNTGQPGLHQSMQGGGVYLLQSTQAFLKSIP